MRFTIDGLLEDIQALRTSGEKLQGIEMGRIVWEQYCDEQIEAARKRAKKDPFCFDLPLRGIKENPACVCGIPIKIVESLGKQVNYVVAPNYIAQGRTWISSESLQKERDVELLKR